MSKEQERIQYNTETYNERKIRMQQVLQNLLREFPNPKTALRYHNPFELLVATILSAQCTDERVNIVTPRLFQVFHDVYALSEATLDAIIDIIRSTGFFQNKAKSIKECAKAIVERHGGLVPRTMEELVSLPGIGRKTANVVLGNAFGIAGLPVDTHVKRIANLLRFTDSQDPEKIEEQLCAIIPKDQWTAAGHLFILHGRKTCIARRPKCEVCVIEGNCPSSKLTP